MPRMLRLAREQSDTRPSCSGSQQIQKRLRPSTAASRAVSWTRGNKTTAHLDMVSSTGLALAATWDYSLANLAYKCTFISLPLL
jgi:hypothetical protein